MLLVSENRHRSVSVVSVCGTENQPRRRERAKQKWVGQSAASPWPGTCPPAVSWTQARFFCLTTVVIHLAKG